MKWASSLYIYIYIYIHAHTYICAYICIYMYVDSSLLIHGIYLEEDQTTGNAQEKQYQHDVLYMYTHAHMYIYVAHIYTRAYVYICSKYIHTYVCTQQLTESWHILEEGSDQLLCI